MSNIYQTVTLSETRQMPTAYADYLGNLQGGQRYENGAITFVAVVPIGADGIADEMKDLSDYDMGEQDKQAAKEFLSNLVVPEGFADGCITLEIHSNAVQQSA